MRNPFICACALVVVCAFGSEGTAQGVLTVPEGLLTPGEDIEIGYSNPERAGEKVTVEINDGGFPNPKVQKVEIQLDDSGEGSGSWTVPEWVAAHFNAPQAQERTRFINKPGAALRAPDGSARELVGDRPLHARDLGGQVGVQSGGVADRGDPDRGRRA